MKTFTFLNIKKLPRAIDPAVDESRWAAATERIALSRLIKRAISNALRRPQDSFGHTRPGKPTGKVLTLAAITSPSALLASTKRLAANRRGIATSLRGRMPEQRCPEEHSAMRACSAPVTLGPRAAGLANPRLGARIHTGALWVMEATLGQTLASPETSLCIVEAFRQPNSPGGPLIKAVRVARCCLWVPSTPASRR